MEVEISGKRKKGQPKKSREEYLKKDLEQYSLIREDAYNQKKQKDQIKAKIVKPGQWG